MGIVGPNMGLIIWDLATDDWNWEQMRTNLARIEFHDHAFGRGTQIPTEGIKDGAITAPKLAPGANIISDGSVTAAKFAQLPATKVYNGATTTLTNGSEVTLTFNTERFDTANLFDSATQPTRLVSPQTGIYLITLSVNLSAAPTATAPLTFAIYKNGTVDSLARSSVVPTTISHTLTTFTRLTAGEYVIARGLNQTGANLNVVAGSATKQDLHDFGMVWVAP